MILTPPVTGADRSKGSSGAAMTLVEFGDYECSYCAAAQETLQALRNELGGGLRFVFRNFPLVSIHPQALAASLVAESADPKTFWGLHDVLYANAGELGADRLLAYARAAGVPDDKARAALDGATLPKVQRDVDSGEARGVQGTPSFFVNGRLHEGEWRGQALAQALLRSSAA